MKSKNAFYLYVANTVFCLILQSSLTAQENLLPTPNLLGGRDALRTIYQQSAGYDPRYDLKTDGVMVYGVDDATVAGYSQWSERSGSVLQMMTGIAWGHYQDFLGGKWDGVDHWDDAQVGGRENPILHAGDKTVPYLNPSIAFCDYLTQRLKKTVDLGVETLYLEEPEFWAFSGYGASFQREWRIFYGGEWERPDSSCDALFKANRLKAHLYRRALDRVGTALKEYAYKKYNKRIKIYVATHSLLSYAQIQMVSPEATLIDLPVVDGLIAQVWTGTARSPNYYQGEFRERTFEMALLEYGVMAEMARGTSKRIYFLNDPVEDDPNHDWNDYRTNYLCTLTASLMRSQTADFEVAPWPSRVFLGRFPSNSPDATTIPDDYASILLAGFGQLRDMDQPKTSWNGASEQIGVLLSDSAMFQRGEGGLWKAASADPPGRYSQTEHERERISGFFSLTLPLLKAGVPVEVPVLDHVTRFPGYLDPYKVLILSYEFQKPLSAGIHSELADWVRRGGTLVYVGSGSDPFLAVNDWWNRDHSDATCVTRLFESLGLDGALVPGEYEVGAGRLIYVKTDPAYYGRSPEAAREYRDLVSHASEAAGLGALVTRNYFLKTRGPYTLAACLDESVSDEPLVLKGNYVDLFDAALPVLHEVTLSPGTRRWLLDLDRVDVPPTWPLASGGRISDFQADERGATCKIAATQGVNIISRWRLAAEPAQVTVGGQPVETRTWDASSRTFYFSYRAQSAEPTELILRYEYEMETNR